jgi:iron complex outermembrane receptor protein
MSLQEKISVKSVRFALAVLAGPALVSVASAQTTTMTDVPQKIEITGSNIKRTEKESSSPVQVITAADIRATGATTVLELMKTIPSIGSGGYNDTPDQNGFSKGVATTSLRGLGSSSTLILLNGRRMVISAFANPNNDKSTLYDLNSIPLSAIERVEVLKDGASAVYGSDAVAGVINFITRTNYTGAEVAVSDGLNEAKQFKKKNANISFGKGDLDADRYNIFGAIDLTHRDPTTARQATAGIKESEYEAINFRLNPYNSNISNQPFFYRESAPGSKAFTTGASVVNLKGCDPSRLITGGPANNITSGTLFNRTFCNYDLDQFTDIQGKADDVSGMLKFNYKLSENHTLNLEGEYTNSKRWYRAASPSISGTSQVANFSQGGAVAPFQAILPIGHPDNPFPGIRAAAVYRFEDKVGGSELTNTNYRLLAGLKGTIGVWDYDTALLWNRSNRDEVIFSQLYLPVLRQITTRSLASLAADPNITKDIDQKGRAEVTQFDAHASTEFGKLGGGAIGVAVGFEVRKEVLTLTPDPYNAAGDIYGRANAFLDGRRTVSGAFVELRTPFSKSFEMDFAGRVDKYENLKANFVPKVGAKWTATDSIALRGTYAEGFRAPALSQITPGGAQTFLNGTVDPIRCPDGVNPLPGAEKTDCSKSIAGIGGANPNLIPEKSKSFTLGLILSPTKDFDILVDGYKVRREGTVALSSSTFILEHNNNDTTQVLRDQNPLNLLVDASGKVIPNSGPLLGVLTPWTNQGSTETSGVDLEFKLRQNLGEYGKVESTLRTSYVLTFKQAEQVGDAEANVAGTRGGLSDWATSVGDIPKIKAYFSTSWKTGDHLLNGSVNYVGGISLLRRSDNAVTYPAPYCYYGTGQPSTAYSLGGLPKYTTYYPDCSIEPWTTVNAGYTYTGFKNLTLGIQISNIFDKTAPYDPAASTNGYNSTLHNPYGRYFDFSARYKF